MKLSEIYAKSKAWMFEKKSSTIYNDYIVEITNKVITELYDENNMLRMFKGKLPFIDGASAHLVSDLSSDIDFEDEYLYDVMPKGITANFLMDDDLNKMSLYQTEYNNARVMRQVMISRSKMQELTEKANATKTDA